MSTDDLPDDRWIELLARGDDVLGTGSALDTVSLLDVPAELRGDLQRDLSHFQRVRRALRRPAPTPETPLVLGRFQVGRELGRGAFGVVFLAHDPPLRRDVAVKVPRADALVTPELRERFGREARAAAGLDHPNIVPVYEAGTVGPLCFVVSAYCPGPTLAQWLQQQTEPVPFRLAATLVATLAEAVDHAHRHGVVHRDLKPSNVLLAACDLASSWGREEAKPQAAPWVPKITDFGLAKLPDGEGQTRSGAIVGSVPYMAPEQAAGKTKEVGPAADTYALGAILYELLAGRPPFRGESELDTLQQVQYEEPLPPARLRRQVPRNLETICLKCLQKEPHRRYAGARALAEDLRAFLEDRPIRARPAGRLERLGRWCRRNPTLAVVTGLAAAALGATVLLSVGFALQQARAAAQLREEQGRTRAALDRAELRAAQLAYERGLILCEQDKPGAGLLWLAHSLELLPSTPSPEATALEGRTRANLAGWRRQVVPLRALLGPAEGDRMGAFSPDGRLLATAEPGNVVRLWAMATMTPVGPPLTHPDVVRVAFSPDGKTLLSANDHGSVRVWDPVTSKCLREHRPHATRIYALAFHPDGHTVLTADAEGTVRLWDVRTGNPSGPVLRQPGGCGGAALSPDGRTILTGGKGFARRRDAVTGKPVGEPLPHPGTVDVVAFSPDGHTLVTGCTDGGVRFWDAVTGQPLGSPLPHGDGIQSIAFSPDGCTVLTGANDRLARLWSAASRKLLVPPLRHEHGVGAVAFHPEGRVIFTSCYAQPDRLWDVAALEPATVVLPHPDEVRAVAFSPDGRTVLTGCKDQRARFWDAGTGQPVGPTLRHKSRILALAFSPDGRTVLTGSHDRTARLTPLPAPLSGTPEAVVLWAQVLTGMELDEEGTIRMLDAAAWQERRQRLEARGEPPLP